ncbi:MAG: hypothetical protein RBT60_06780 [Candidatus Krumholzibacteria bacterium]|jgi:hypothetical protein|nr:hypothetical protein [Candidatus Krumholzibacteria bacterium]
MLKSVAVRVFAALVIVAVMGVDQSMAGLPGEVAHSAMGGSTLMQTSAQFNSWTHWIVKHENFVELNVGDWNYGPYKYFGTGRGQAALHWKYDDGNHFLFRVRQNDLGSQNSNFLWGGTLENSFLSAASLLDEFTVSEYNAYREGQMLNMAWARPLASGGAFSIGVLFANAGYKEEETDEEDFEDKSSAFGAQVTWGNGSGFDLAASFYSESSTYGAGTGEVESDLTHFDLAARFETSSGWIYQFGGLMGSGAGYPYIEGDYRESDISFMGLTANVGRHLLDTANAGVTTEFYVSYLSRKAEFDYVDEEEETLAVEVSESAMTVPGMRVACWTQISKRFQIMAGANAFWTTYGDKTEAGSWEGKIAKRGMNFSYSGGLAFVPNDRVRIEGQLEMDQLNNLLSLGNNTPLLMRVGGTFVF